MGETDALQAEINELRRLVESLGESSKRHDEDIRQLFAAHEGTKVYVGQILDKLNQLETKLFSLVTQLTTTTKEERKEERKERSKEQQSWIEFSKYVIGATVGAIIIYLLK